MARALASIAFATVAAVAGCGSSSDDSNHAVGATPGAGGATAGGQGAGPTFAPGATIFARQYGDEGQQTLNDLAVDDAGNSYVVGSEFPLGALEAAFVVQYDASGTFRWRQPFVTDGVPFNARVQSVALQPTTGAVILAGFLAGTMTVGEDGLKVESGVDPSGFHIPSVWLTAIDKAGYVVWSKVFPSQNAVFPDQVFVTASGDIELVGTSRDNATVGGEPLCCQGPDLGITTFVARYSPTGQHLWSRAIGGRFFPGGADTDAAGGLVIGGTLSGTATFDGETFVSGGFAPDGRLAINGMVFRLDPDGHKVWNEILPADNQVFPAARLDRAGNILLFGTFQGEVDLGNGQHLSFMSAPEAFQPAAFLAKLAPGGTPQWARTLPPIDAGFVQTADLAVDAAGNLALTGIATGGVSLAGVAGRADVGSGDFVARYAPDGTYVWSRGFAVVAGVEIPPFVAVAFEPSGRVTAAGNFDNMVDFGTATLTAPGVPTNPGRGAPAPHIPDDVFVVKLAP